MTDKPAVIAAHGDVDIDSLGPLQDELGSAAASHRTVILDASDITFCDSSFLNLLLHIHQATTLRIAAPSEPVRRLLEVTGVDRVMNLHPTTDAARAATAGTGLPLTR
ncbi:STAS domain-containing protein [Streptomyces sp. NBC_00370]|uniref:STAS domain-containing protein n=1 Tax=Streptomyces sp. NBC_00370 TaxID=2975728 RepID=UPI002E26AAC6